MPKQPLLVTHLALLCCLLLVAADPTDAGNWMQFRGPAGGGASPSTTPAPIQWSESENLQWKVDLPGPGSSSPIVVGDKVFVTCWSGYGLDRQNPGEQDQLQRHLVCIDRSNGEIVWDKTVAPYLPEDQYGGMFAEHGYASHTPVSDGEQVFAFFGKSGVVAFDLDGNQQWQQSVGTESGARNWGSASSPILYKNLVIVPATAESEALVALDKRTGEEVWRKEARGFNSVWGTPTLCEVDDQRTDLVVAVPNEVWGFRPEDGAFLWLCRAFGSSSFCSSPVAHDGVVYAMENGPGGGGGIAVQAGGQGDVTDTHVLWQGRQQGRIATPVYHHGKLYNFTGGVAVCYDASTGDQVFRSRLRDIQRGGRNSTYASPTVAGDAIYYPLRSGDVVVCQATDEYLQLAVNRVGSDDDEDFSATPAISDGQILLRSSKRLYAIADDDGQSDQARADVLAAAREAAAQQPDDDGQNDADDDSRGGRRGRFNPRDFFRRLDANNDGRLASDELEARWRDQVMQADADKDGFVSQSEFDEGMRQIFARGRRGSGRGSGRDAPQKPERPQRPEFQ